MLGGGQGERHREDVAGCGGLAVAGAETCLGLGCDRRAGSEQPAAVSTALPCTLSMTVAAMAAMTAVTYQKRGGSRGGV